jgi:hypothetical protein
MDDRFCLTRLHLQSRRVRRTSQRQSEQRTDVSDDKNVSVEARARVQILYCYLFSSSTVIDAQITQEEMVSIVENIR